MMKRRLIIFGRRRMPWSDYEETTHMNKEKNGFRTAAVKLGLSPKDLSQRNGVVNAVLVGVKVAAVFYGLWLCVELATQCYHDVIVRDRWLAMGFADFIGYHYGKGFLPGFLVCIAVAACNARVMRWKQDGVYAAFVALFVISCSTMFCRMGLFLYFSAFSVAAYLMYVLALCLPKEGANTFQRSKQVSHAWGAVACVSFVVWLCLAVWVIASRYRKGCLLDDA